MKIPVSALFCSLILFTTSTVVAQQPRSCFLNGQLYPHGSRVGSYICLDGTWTPL